MAQTRRRRQTKHRGNAAGVVESRGRTGRKPTAAEKKGDGKPMSGVQKKPLDKRDQPPTWRGAFVKSMFATIVFLLIVLLFFKHGNSAIAVFPIVLAGYTAISYYTDKFMYDRRQRKKAREGKAQQAR
jgi:hypothetical protein